MHRGLEVGLHLTTGLPDEAFVATAIGNLAGFELQRERDEPIEWQVLRVVGPGQHHHYRLILRHPTRALDIGLQRNLTEVLDRLSHESLEELRRRFAIARGQGLSPVNLRTVTEAVDFWQDDFWNWIGGPSGFGLPPTTSD